MKALRRSRHIDTIFLMTVGVLLGWSLIAAIMSTTILSQNHVATLFRMLFIIGALRLIVSHKYYIWATAALLCVSLIFIATGFLTSPEEPSLANRAAAFIENTIRFLQGYEYHSIGYERAVVWGFSITIGLFIVAYTHIRFQFFVIFIVSVAAFSLLLTSRFFAYQLAFDVFAFCLLAYLIRYLNERSAQKAKSRISFSVYALLLALFCMIAAALMPTPQEGIAQSFNQSGIVRQFHRINDFIYSISRPNHFSLRQTGFGADGQLGGDVGLNESLFMRLRIDNDSPQPIYLAGNILDTYTGYSWENNLDEREPMPFGQISPNLDLYERATAEQFVGILFEESVNMVTVHRSYVSIGRRIPMEDLPLDEEREIDLDALLEMTDISNWISEQRDYHQMPDYGIRITTLIDEIEIEIIGPSEDPQFMGYSVSFPSELVRFDSRISDIDMRDHAPRNLLIGTLGYRTHTIFSPGIVQRVYAHNADPTFVREQSGRLLTEALMPRYVWYTVQYSPLSGLGPEEPAYDGERGTSSSVPVRSPGTFWLYDEEGGIGGIIPPPLHMRRLEYAYRDVPPHLRILLYSRRGVLRELNARIAQSPGTAQITRQNGQTMSFETLLSDYLIPRADWIYEVYTALPEDFPARIGDLARSVTEGAYNDYMRARMLEEYLSSSFRYTLTPGDPPPDQDFVYHFLFDIQEGYCTYFATAFVTMARTLGLPARYVEGFVVSGEPGEHGLISVLNRMGHAWGEVYFEGFGWHRFEPTPAGGIPTAHHPHAVPAFTPDVYDPFHWELEQLLGRDRPGTAGIGGAPGEAAPGLGAAVAEAWPMGATATVAISAAVLGLSALIARVLWIYIRDEKARKKENGPAVLHYFRVLLNYMRFFNFEIKGTETADQFTDRVANNFGFPNETFFPKEITGIFEKARYSPHEISAQERRQVESAVKKIDATMQSYTGRGRYLFYKYILARV